MPYLSLQLAGKVTVFPASAGCIKAPRIYNEISYFVFSHSKTLASNNVTLNPTLPFYIYIYIVRIPGHIFHTHFRSLDLNTFNGWDWILFIYTYLFFQTKCVSKSCGLHKCYCRMFWTKKFKLFCVKTWTVCQEIFSKAKTSDCLSTMTWYHSGGADDAVILQFTYSTYIYILYIYVLSVFL